MKGYEGTQPTELLHSSNTCNSNSTNNSKSNNNCGWGEGAQYAHELSAEGGWRRLLGSRVDGCMGMY